MARFASRLYTLDTVDSLKFLQIGQDPQIDQRASSQMCGERLCLDPLLCAFAFWQLLSGCRKVNHLLQDVFSMDLKGCWSKTLPLIEVPHPHLSWLLPAKLPKAGLWQCFWSSRLWQFSVENYSGWGRSILVFQSINHMLFVQQNHSEHHLSRDKPAELSAQFIHVRTSLKPWIKR